MTAHRPPLRAAVAMGAAALAAFVLLAFTPAAGAISRWLEAPADLRPADAIVVLGAGASRDGQLSNQSLRRLVGGLALYHRGLAPRIIVMGPAYEGGPVEAEVRAALARDVGIPAEALVVESQGVTTRHEAALAAARLPPGGGRRILLVTGVQHMVRARRLFERAGLEVIPAPVVEISAAVQRPENRMELARLVVQEAIARLYYRLAGEL
jgi:uncharacterized SAM-binding protein YcdF (DUF218 family)